MRTLSKLVLVLATTLAFASPVAADEQEDETQTWTLNEFNADASKSYQVDTAIPSAPAFALLGADTPSTIGIPFGGDQYFNFGPGDEGLPEIGFATRPYWTVFNQDQGVVDYRGWADPNVPDAPSWNDRLRHIAGRTIVSFAVGPVRGGETSTGGAAIGVSSSLLDNADPRLDRVFANCVREVLAARGGPSGIGAEEAAALAQAFANATWNVPANVGVTAQANTVDLRASAIRDHMRAFFANNPWGPFTERLLERKFTNGEDRAAALALYRGAGERRAASFARAADTAYGECVGAARKRYLEEPDLTVGFGSFMQGEEEDSLEGLGYAGTSVWVGYRYPLSLRDGRQGAFNAYARYEERTDQPLENNVISDTQTIVAYADYSLSTDRWRFTVAASFNSREYDDAAVEDREFARYSVSGEYRIQENTWVELGYGALSEDVPGEESFGYLRLKYNLSGGNR